MSERRRRRKPSRRTVFMRSLLLKPERLADERIYYARRNLLKAYGRLVRVSSRDDLGHARAHALDAVDLLNDLFGFE